MFRELGSFNRLLIQNDRYRMDFENNMVIQGRFHFSTIFSIPFSPLRKWYGSVDFGILIVEKMVWRFFSGENGISRSYNENKSFTPPLKVPHTHTLFSALGLLMTMQSIDYRENSSDSNIKACQDLKIYLASCLVSKRGFQ